ncbi:unnamed protein product [Ophioblennius macclurei]
MSAPATFNLSVVGGTPEGVGASAATAATTCPQVFVVDSQAGYVSAPMEKKARTVTTTALRLLLLLVLVALLGLLLQGYFIYRLYQKMEPFSPTPCQSVCGNKTNHDKSGPQAGGVMSQVGLRDLNENIMQKRAFAHLISAKNRTLENNVVQWESEGVAFTHNMKHRKDMLTVEKGGYYYVYSKVQVNAAEECHLIQHKVMRHTDAYPRPMMLMKSKNYRCRSTKPPVSTSDDMWNSYLAGIFYLRKEDSITVELESKHGVQMSSGVNENFMGAFLISS